MRISVLCSGEHHPVFSMLKEWQQKHGKTHSVELVIHSSKLSGGEILFLISCAEIICADVRSRYKATLVIHASELPKGRGWSPHIWQILEGKNSIMVTLLEAEDHVDSGAIWAQERIEFEGHELYDEINSKLFRAESLLMDFALEHFSVVRPQPQKDIEPTYYRKRSPEDSRIDPYKSIAEQFDTLRVADPARFPVFFDYRGHRYELALSKINKSEGKS